MVAFGKVIYRKSVMHIHFALLPAVSSLYYSGDEYFPFTSEAHPHFGIES
jgi:hypothetical protein